MTHSELAAILDGNQYRQEITKGQEVAAKEAGLVVVFGASDDLMEFRGAIRDEVDCYEGGTAYLTDSGMLVNVCEDDDCPFFAKQKERAPTIEAVWDSEGYSWTYKTAIPHSTFVIMEDGEKYCRGIVFKLSELAKA